MSMEQWWEAWRRNRSSVRITRRLCRVACELDNRGIRIRFPVDTDFSPEPPDPFGGPPSCSSWVPCSKATYLHLVSRLSLPYITSLAGLFHRTVTSIVNYGVEGPHLDLVWDAVPTFAWCNWTKPPKTQVMIVGTRPGFEPVASRTWNSIGT